MILVSTRIITADVSGLVKFYEQITGLKVVQYTTDFVELKTRSATLAIGSIKTLKFFGGDSVAQACQNRSAIIEFMVEDVDKEFLRLIDFLQPFIVQQPTTMPWGNRSLLLRDPDGNLINLFTPLSVVLLINRRMFFDCSLRNEIEAAPVRSL